MVLLYPYQTEKTLKLAEKQNVITFIVERRATKKQIKEEFEKKYKVKVIKVNTLITRKGLKKAYIKLSKEHNAAELFAKLTI
jgi:large subunit ribosomal protein L23